MGEYVGDAITSVINGSFDNFELIVIDDGSTDNTRSVVEQFTRRKAPQYDPRVRY
jgi:glycosyltransferase involved in cell wall biosynthesis